MLLEHTTIKEIAERANVSTATVSRILNGKHCHRSSTVETVRRAIEELRAEGPVLTGFETAAAESVGIMMISYRDFLNTNYTATLVTAMGEALTAEDLSVQLLTLSSKRLSIGYIESMIRAHRLRGLLIPEFDILYAISEKLVKLPIPVIGIGNLAEPGLPNCVCADNTGAGRDAANYLWSMGHRRFGLLSMAYSDICQRQRITGFRDTIQELGGNPGQVWSRQYRSQDDSVSGAVSELANMKNPPTAILSTNSQITLKLQSGLVQAGFRIPDDISLLSFEENGELEFQPVPISVLRQPTRSLGEVAVRMLINCIRDIPVNRQEVLNCSLIARESVRNLAGAAELG